MFRLAEGGGLELIEIAPGIDLQRDILARIDHADTSIAVSCERAFLAELDGSCKTPIAGHATLQGNTLHFRGLIARPDGGAAHDIAGNGHLRDAVQIGEEAGRELKHAAGPRFFD